MENERSGTRYHCPNLPVLRPQYSLLSSLIKSEGANKAHWTSTAYLYPTPSTHYWAHSEYLKTPESEGANKACWCGTVKINNIQYFYKIYVNRINSVIKVKYKASWESSKYSNSYSNLCMGLIMFEWICIFDQWVSYLKCLSWPSNFWVVGCLHSLI